MTPLRASRLAALTWLEHGFGTRGDGAWTPAAETARLHQIHTDQVVAVGTPGHHGDGDALITAQPGLWLEIRTADCVPILIVDTERRVVAAVHAGWRGTAAAIARVTVEEMRRKWDCQPADLAVAIGPSIGVCCFEVGEEVAGQFPGHFTRPGARAHVNLVSANREQLANRSTGALHGMRSLALPFVPAGSERWANGGGDSDPILTTGENKAKKAWPLPRLFVDRKCGD